ncbi:hypothetical protein MTO96_020242 [Rhipicephalus appendiculatus]
MTIDTACSSSLSALNEAVLALRSKRCNAAIVGGSCLTLDPALSVMLMRLGILSKDGKCKAFDSQSNGYTRSESVGAFFLQRASAARRVYAKVINIRVNTDGYKTEGITFPSGRLQEQLLRDVYAEARIDPDQVGYVEAHGTGTRAGDVQELTAISRVFCKPGRERPLKIGSVKTNVGHTEAAAEGPVGISSYGFGGANVHAILQCHDGTCRHHIDTLQRRNSQLPRLVLLAGRSEESLVRTLDRVEAEGPYPDSAYALLNQVGQPSVRKFPCRGFVIVPVDESGNKAIKMSSCCPSERRPLWFVFTGVGCQWDGMATRMMQFDPFARSIQKSHDFLQQYGMDLIHVLTSDNPGEDRIRWTHLSIVAMQAILRRIAGSSADTLGLMKRKADNPLIFLSSLGKLHNLGVQMNLSPLYPTVSWPVPRGTPNIAHLVSWNHSQSWTVVNWKDFPSSSQESEEIVEVDVESNEADRFLSGHVADGRLLFPASGHILLAWKTLAKRSGMLHDNMPVILENITIHREIVLPSSGPVRLSVSVLRLSGEFEIGHDGNVVATGRVRAARECEKVLDKDPPGRPAEIVDYDLDGADVYKELRLRGCEYSGAFRGILKADVQTFFALTRLPRWLEDARLRAWRRFLPRFERMLVADDEEVDRAWRRLLLRLFVLRWLLSDRVAELSGLRVLRTRPPWRLRDELRDRPRLTFLRALRRWGDSLAVSLMVLVRELLDRFLRLTLRALVGTALMFAGFSLVGCDTSAAFRSLRAAVVAAGSGASGSTDTALGGRPRGRLAGGFSLDGPAPLSAAEAAGAAWRFACRPAFGGFSPPSTFFGMAGSLRVPSHRQPSIPCSQRPSSALPLAGEGGPQETASVRVRESPDSAASRAEQLPPSEAAFGSRAPRA